jgi:hypothetical protein
MPHESCPLPKTQGPIQERITGSEISDQFGKENADNI